MGPCWTTERGDRVPNEAVRPNPRGIDWWQPQPVCSSSLIPSDHVASGPRIDANVRLCHSFALMRRAVPLSLAVVVLGLHNLQMHDLGTVLCVGSDGQVELEAGADAGCAGRGETMGVSFDSTSQCAPCFDLPLGCTHAVIEAQAPVTNPSVAVDLPTSPLVAPVSTSHCRLSVSPAASSTELASLRTVQIRI